MKNNKKNILSKSDIKNLVFEAVGNGVQRVVSTAATRDNKAVQDAALKTAEEKVAALTPPTKGPTIPTVEYGAEANKGQERLKYDYINDKFKERVKALVLGKDSPLQKSIDPSSGVDIKGNEKFLQRAKELNKADQDNKGIAGNAVAQYGRQFQVLQGVKPKTDNNAFESKEMKNKVKVGDIFIENKNNLKLKVTGLTEDKSSVNFLEENTNKKYSLKIENFKKGVKDGKIIRERNKRYQVDAEKIKVRARPERYIKYAKELAHDILDERFGDWAGEYAEVNLSSIEIYAEPYFIHDEWDYTKFSTQKAIDAAKRDKKNWRDRYSLWINFIGYNDGTRYIRLSYTLRNGKLEFSDDHTDLITKKDFLKNLRKAISIIAEKIDKEDTGIRLRNDHDIQNAPMGKYRPNEPLMHKDDPINIKHPDDMNPPRTSEFESRSNKNKKIISEMKYIKTYSFKGYKIKENQDGGFDIFKPSWDPTEPIIDDINSLEDAKIWILSDINEANESRSNKNKLNELGGKQFGIAKRSNMEYNGYGDKAYLPKSKKDDYRSRYQISHDADIQFDLFLKKIDNDLGHVSDQLTYKKAELVSFFPKIMGGIVKFTIEVKYDYDSSDFVADTAYYDPPNRSNQTLSLQWTYVEGSISFKVKDDRGKDVTDMFNSNVYGKTRKNILRKIEGEIQKFGDVFMEEQGEEQEQEPGQGYPQPQRNRLNNSVTKLGKRLNELDYQQGRSPQVQGGNYKVGDKVVIYEIPSTITAVNDGLVTTEADRNGETSNWSTEEFNNALQSGDAQITNETYNKNKNKLNELGGKSLGVATNGFLTDKYPKTDLPKDKYRSREGLVIGAERQFAEYMRGELKGGNIGDPTTKVLAKNFLSFAFMPVPFGRQNKGGDNMIKLYLIYSLMNNYSPKYDSKDNTIKLIFTYIGEPTLNGYTKEDGKINLEVIYKKDDVTNEFLSGDFGNVHKDVLTKIEGEINKYAAETSELRSEMMNSGYTSYEWEWDGNKIDDEWKPKKYAVGDKVKIQGMPSTIISISKGFVRTEVDEGFEPKNGMPIKNRIQKWTTKEFDRGIMGGYVKITNETKMKQLRFSKTSFLSEDHMRTLIPEAYKVKGTRLSMIDNKNHQYIVEFNHSKEIFICEEKNPQKNIDSLNRIKQLFEYKREEYLKPQAEILKENDAFTDILSTVRKLKEGKGR
jgi:hypothetical protein